MYKNPGNSSNDRNASDFDNGILMKELRKSEANYRLIFQKSALPQLICAQNDLRITNVNEAALDL